MKAKLLSALYFLSLPVLMTIAQNDPVLMTINGKHILKSEFEYIYKKNSRQQIEDKLTIADYAEMFVNFKLKVDQAERMGLDTTSTFIKELAGYREQLAKPYLIDERVEDSIVNVVYERMQENVEVSHILLSLEKDAPESKCIAVRSRLMKIKERIEKGEDFHTLAKQISEDPSAKQNSGALGYIQPFLTVLPFEDAAYATAEGKVSDPVRTDFGYHLIYVTNRRKDQGELRTAHIMKSYGQNPSEEEVAKSKKEIDDIYVQLKSGVDFAELAENESDDNGSARYGGMLPWFGKGRMVPEFEQQTYALKRMGDITEPFRTAYGWHIAKLIERRGIGSLLEKRQEILRKIARDERGTMSKDMLVARLISEYEVELNTQTKTAILDYLDKGKMDSEFVDYLAEMNAPFLQSAVINTTTSDLAVFLKNKPVNEYEIAISEFEKYARDYVNIRILAFEKSQLEKKYPEFDNLLREYRDGILLFEVSTKEVWDKALTEEDGIVKYFKKNKKNYKWDEPRYKGFVIACKDKDTQKEVKKLIKDYPTDSLLTVLPREINRDGESRVVVEYGLHKRGEHKGFDNLAFGEGNQEWMGDYPEQFFEGERQRKYPSDYTDVKGQVVSDYQAYLESQWIKEMRKISEIEVNEDILKTINPL